MKKKIIKLTETELYSIVKMVIKEESTSIENFTNTVKTQLVKTS